MQNTVEGPHGSVRFPIGGFAALGDVTSAQRHTWIRQMAETPGHVARALAGLDEGQLRTPYREGGWTPTQVVHHLADAHLNGFARFKMALTEDAPAVKTYEEDRWAETADGRDAPAALSVQLLTALHTRWDVLLRSLPESEFAKAFRHPDRGVMTLDKAIQLYAWHGLHHTAHITSLRERRGW